MSKKSQSEKKKELTEENPELEKESTLNYLLTSAKDAEGLSSEVKQEGDRDVAEWGREIAGFNQSISMLKRWLYILIISVSSATIMIYGFSTSWNLTSFFIPFSLMTIGLLIFVHLFTDALYRKLSKGTHAPFGENLGMVPEASQSMGAPLKVGVDLSPLAKALDKFRLKSQDLIVAVASHTTALQNYFDETKRRHELDLFVRSFRGSLLDYAIVIDGSLDDTINKFSSTAKTEEKWLEEMCPQVSPLTNLRLEVLRVIYYDYTQRGGLLQKAWEQLTDTEARFQFTKLLISAEPTEFARPVKKEDFGAITAMLFPAKKSERESYNRSRFRLLYSEFYTSLAAMKSLLIEAFGDFGFKVDDETRKQIKRYFPSSTDQNVWRDEVVGFSGGLLGVDKKTAALIFFDAIERKDLRSIVWKSIGVEDYDSLADLLLEYKLNSIPAHYKQNEEALRGLVRDTIEATEDFGFTTVSRKISNFLEQLDIEKKSIVQACERFNLFLPSKASADFQSYLPEEEDFLEPLATKFSALIESQNHIPWELVVLFYHYHRNDQMKDKYFMEIRDAESLPLSTLLLSKAIIKWDSKKELGQEVSNLSYVIRSIEKYDLVLIQNLYQTYSGFSSMTAKLTDFLVNQGLLAK